MYRANFLMKRCPILDDPPCSLLVSWKAAHKGDKSGLYCLENSSRTEKRVCMHEFGPIKSPPVSVLIIPSVHRLFRMQPLGLLHSLAFSGSAHFPIRPTVASLGREKNEREHAIDDLVGVRIDQTREEKVNKRDISAVLTSHSLALLRITTPNKTPPVLITKHNKEGNSWTDRGRTFFTGERSRPNRFRVINNSETDYYSFFLVSPPQDGCTTLRKNDPEPCLW
ncbi:hypothetical protein GEV33_014156 [Tenebrio molitor]|uniref:Uncharacterized protein n=1 Tax=Tenebrio molitor TaxID=7067 RepID=A0A8J6H6I9_TENMO|nr:hypothetical protein GEV33_014156 [Tenebrio molitor]